MAIIRKFAYLDDNGKIPTGQLSEHTHNLEDISDEKLNSTIQKVDELKTETWTLTLTDGSTVTKNVVVK